MTSNSVGEKNNHAHVEADNDNVDGEMSHMHMFKCKGWLPDPE